MCHVGSAPALVEFGIITMGNLDNGVRFSVGVEIYSATMGNLDNGSRFNVGVEICSG